MYTTHFHFSNSSSATVHRINAEEKGAAAFGNRITRFLTTRIPSSAEGRDGGHENTISLAVRERKRERVTCSNVTLALLFQRQGEEKLGPSFLFNCHELQDKQFPRLSFLLRKPRFRNRPPDGQSVNDSIFHYHWNVSQLRLNPPFQDSSSRSHIPKFHDIIPIYIHVVLYIQ